MTAGDAENQSLIHKTNRKMKEVERGLVMERKEDLPLANPLKFLIPHV